MSGEALDPRGLRFLHGITLGSAASCPCYALIVQAAGIARFPTRAFRLNLEASLLLLATTAGRTIRLVGHLIPQNTSEI
jgi:hypothetical protein